MDDRYKLLLFFAGGGRAHYACAMYFNTLKAATDASVFYSKLGARFLIVDDVFVDDEEEG